MHLGITFFIFSEFESVLNTLSKISTCVDQHSIILAEINRRASLAGSELLIPPECIISENFPFQTLTSFQEFENKLTDTAVWEYMVSTQQSLLKYHFKQSNIHKQDFY